MTLPDQALCRGDIRLELLTREHVPGLITAAGDGRLWELFFTSVPTPEAMPDRVDSMIGQHAAETMLPFAVCTTEGTTVGMTSLCHLDWTNRRGEIGYTWYAGSSQGSGVNTSAKLLLLQLAFDQLGFIAVELRTHWLNHRSRAAIERLGAKMDGVLRSHQVMPDGTLRDTVVYSIIASEWPAVRAHLAARELAAHRDRHGAQ